MKQKKVIKICTGCQKPFKTVRAKFCSLKCSNRHKSGYNTIHKCLSCGNDFLRKKSNQKYCSTECYTQKDKQTKIFCLKCNKQREALKGKCIFCIIDNKKLSYEAVSQNMKHYLEIEEFLYEMKRKRYFADESDIFKTIHYYDLIKPDVDPPDDNPLTLLNQFFFEISQWYKKKRRIIVRRILSS